MYADDGTVYCSDTNISNVETKLQSDLTSIQKWGQFNNMIPNPKKSSCMVLGTCNKLRAANDLTLTIENKKMVNVSCQKLLGVYIDKNLNWNIQVSKMC